jgi:hypothetical protein
MIGTSPPPEPWAGQTPVVGVTAYLNPDGVKSVMQVKKVVECHLYRYTSSTLPGEEADRPVLDLPPHSEDFACLDFH